MSIRRLVPAAALMFTTTALLPTPGSAQPLGTFRWQLQPHCNVLTLTVTQVEGVYRLEGTDDQCGAGRARASVLGLAFPNPSGAIGLGLTIVTAPGGVAVHVDAEITLASLSGTWRDSAGTQGAFVFTPGAPTPGYPLPAPTAAVPPAISLNASGSLVARDAGTPGIPASGPGTRMMWYPFKAAFRAGRVTSDGWDDANVGQYSTALGIDVKASGLGSTALGSGAQAEGAQSTALGFGTRAAGANSTALGRFTVATGESSLAAGLEARADGGASVALGVGTVASGNASTALGRETKATGDSSASGGYKAQASGMMAFAFGVEAVAAGDISVALGFHAGTGSGAPGSFVFADGSSSNAFTSLLPNEFGVRAAGGVYLYTSAGLGSGAALAANGSSWAALSDVNAKENFREIDGEDLLTRLARVPVREWNYKAQGVEIRHIGPTAQDFRAAFDVGDFPTRINTIDADGVALAGVKALEARTRALQDENAALRERLARLEALLERR
jgi:hypothetical protein